MNIRLILRTLGLVLVLLAALLLLPMICALLCGESPLPYIYTILLTATCGSLLMLVKPTVKTLYTREGFLTVSLTWILVSLFGCLPFVFSGAIPSFVDAFFETVSGFTTTGSTLLTDVEALPRGILFWRSFTHWIGGMGVIVFLMALLPSAGAHSVYIMKAEVPGTTFGKVSPKLSETAKWLYYVYFALTALEVVFLLAGGMPLFDSLVHAFGTAGTGGFSNMNASIGAYNSPYFDIVITVFMFLFGINFNIFFLLIFRDFKNVLKSDELWAYLGTFALSSLLIAWNITSIYGSFGTALRYSSFQVSSIITTTGYATADYCTWPAFSQAIIILLMFVGACGGSTGGGVKLTRWILYFKKIFRDLYKMIHPRSVRALRLNGKTVDEETLDGVPSFIALFGVLAGVGTLLVTLSCGDLATSFSAVLTCLGNVGPGIGAVGPTGNFAFFSAPIKLLLSFFMLLGRLELYPLLLSLTPMMYRKK